MKKTIICAICFGFLVILSVMLSSFANLDNKNSTANQTNYNLSQNNASPNTDSQPGNYEEDSFPPENEDNDTLSPNKDYQLFLTFNNACNNMFDKLRLFNTCLYLEIFQSNYIFRKNLATNLNSNNLKTAIDLINKFTQILIDISNNNETLNQDLILNDDNCINTMNRVYQILNIICELDKKIADGTLADFLI